MPLRPESQNIVAKATENVMKLFSFIKDIAQMLSCTVLCNSATRSLSDASPVGDAIPACLSIYDSCCRFRFLFAHASFQYKRRMYRHVSLSCSRATQYTPQYISGS